MQLSDELRERFVFLGPAKVRRMIDNGMMVMHLVQPAEDWLDEIEPKGASTEVAVSRPISSDNSESEAEKPNDATVEGKGEHRAQREGDGGERPPSGAGEGGGFEGGAGSTSDGDATERRISYGNQIEA